jgi:hypothetical protein
MMIKIAASLLAVSLLASCTSTTTTTKRTTLRETNAARLASANTNEPAPPAEGPEEVGAGPLNPAINPALVPSPLLRTSAAGGP